MAYKEVLRVEIWEVIRRWRTGHSQRRIASGTGLSRDTVVRYITLTEALGVSRLGPEPSEKQLSRLAVIGQSGPRQAETPSEDLLSPWADQIHRWLTGDRLQLTRIHELLLGRGCQVSYQSLRRFVQKRNCRRPSKVTVRMEDTPPGEVVEVDFGRLGLIHDPETGRRRAVWAGVAAGAGLLQALLPLAHLRADAGGRHRWARIGLVFLRRHPQVPGHRQLSTRGGDGGPAASPLHQGFLGILPTPRIHRRRGADAPF